jgi:hypothetical protein
MLGTSGLLFEASYDKPGTYLVQVSLHIPSRSESVLFSQLERTGSVPFAASKKHHHAANDYPQWDAL